MSAPSDHGGIVAIVSVVAVGGLDGVGVDYTITFSERSQRYRWQLRRPGGQDLTGWAESKREALETIGLYIRSGSQPVRLRGPRTPWGASPTQGDAPRAADERP